MASTTCVPSSVFIDNAARVTDISIFYYSRCMSNLKVSVTSESDNIVIRAAFVLRRIEGYLGTLHWSSIFASQNMGNLYK